MRFSRLNRKKVENRTEEKKIFESETNDTVATLSEQKAESEKKAIQNALEVCGGNKAKTARMLNISRTLLYKKLEKYSIS